MDFQQSKNYVLKFGRYSGVALDQIATDSRGLTYLDWLRGEMEDSGETDRPSYRAICAYLDDPTIASELAAALERRKQ